MNILLYQDINIIESYKNKSYIKEVIPKLKDEGFYIPYFPIIRKERETTKVRLVFDCSAKYNGKESLNDQILPGPKLQNDISEIITRFRRFKFGVVADISEMYLNISLRPEDRKFCRFFWKNEVYEWTRTLFVRSDAPYIALYVVQRHAEK